MQKVLDILKLLLVHKKKVGVIAVIIAGMFNLQFITALFGNVEVDYCREVVKQADLALVQPVEADKAKDAVEEIK